MSLHQDQDCLRLGPPLAQASGVVILLHGRGASAADIIGLSGPLGRPGLVWWAPQAADAVWLPQRYFAPWVDNQPWLDSALQVIADLVAQALAGGVAPERIFLGGFSQGACLAAEFALRHPRRWGGVLVFSGSALGPDLGQRTVPGDLAGTPVLVACGDPDPYFALADVLATADLFEQAGAQVERQILPGLGHRIAEVSLLAAQRLLGSGDR